MDYVEIGKIKKPHGLNGEIKATIDERFWNDVAGVEVFFVDIRGTHTPYFVDYLRGKGVLILKFEDINTKEDASIFTNKRLYLRRDDVSLSEEEINDDGLEFSYLEGYVLFEEELGEIGKVELVEEYPQQEMAVVKYKEKEILIPVLASWIVNVDKENKKLTMRLPEGLVEM